MAIIVVLVPSSSGGPRLQPETLRRLSDLGVTDVSLVRDDETVGIVLQGWTLDPARSGARVAAVVAAESASRLLLPVLEAAVVPSARAAPHLHTGRAHEIDE